MLAHSHHRLVLKCPAPTGERNELVFDLTPPLRDVSEVWLVGVDVANSGGATSEVNLDFSSLGAHVPWAYYGEGSASAPVPAVQTNGAKFVVRGDQTFHEDAGHFGNNPQLIFKDCSSLSRILVTISGFRGQATGQALQGLWLYFKAYTKEPTWHEAPAYINNLPNGFVSDGRGWSVPPPKRR